MFSTQVASSNPEHTRSSWRAEANTRACGAYKPAKPSSECIAPEIFSQEDRKDQLLAAPAARRTANPRHTVGGQRAPQKSLLALSIFRSSCKKISFAQGGLGTLR